MLFSRNKGIYVSDLFVWVVSPHRCRAIKNSLEFDPPRRRPCYESALRGHAIKLKKDNYVIYDARLS